MRERHPRRAHWHLVAFIALVVWVYPGLAGAEEPLRRGFTVEVGAGPSFTRLRLDQGETKGGFGFAPLSFGIGGFVSSKVALMFRAAEATYFDRAVRALTDSGSSSSGGGGDTLFMHQFAGAVVQVWVSDSVYLSAGPGVVVVGPHLFADGKDTGHKVGYGGSFRGGFSFYTVKHHSLRVALEVLPGRMDRVTVTSGALCFEWQYF